MNRDIADGIPVMCPPVKRISRGSARDSDTFPKRWNMVPAVAGAVARVSIISLFSHACKCLESFGILTWVEFILDEVQILALKWFVSNFVITHLVLGRVTENQLALLVVVEHNFSLDGSHGRPADEPFAKVDTVVSL